MLHQSESVVFFPRSDSELGRQLLNSATTKLKGLVPLDSAVLHSYNQRWLNFQPLTAAQSTRLYDEQGSPLLFVPGNEARCNGSDVKKLGEAIAQVTRLSPWDPA